MNLINYDSTMYMSKKYTWNNELNEVHECEYGFGYGIEEIYHLLSTHFSCIMTIMHANDDIRKATLEVLPGVLGFFIM